jgi:hypothetical protein
MKKKPADGYSEEEIMSFIDAAVKPKNLLELKRSLMKAPDEHLEKYIVFIFGFGDEHGYSEWKRKETPKQYWKRRRLERRGVNGDKHESTIRSKAESK